MWRGRLSQVFLRNEGTARRIVEAFGPTRADLVVEIGAGRGALTRWIVGKAGYLIAVELDHELCESLRALDPSEENLFVLCEDFLKIDLHELISSWMREKGLSKARIIGNIPYHITTPILKKVLGSATILEDAMLTVQKEVAERMVARPGGRKYGRLSIFVQVLADPNILFLIPPGSFYPTPKVASAVVHLKMLGKPRVDVEMKAFLKVVEVAFSERRKKLVNSLSKLGVGKEELVGIMGKAGIEPSTRPEMLTIDDFSRISKALMEVCPSLRSEY
jgi:16S rRNA (adenine1518-N6/adenine1519-N6)-dimethyltransferase